MLHVTLTDPQGQTQELALDLSARQPFALIGRATHCGVRLHGWRVAREHARLRLDDAGQAHLEDLGSLSGTLINSERVVKHGPLDFSDEIRIAGHILRVKAAGRPRPGSPAANDDAGSPPAGFPPERAGPQAARTVHGQGSQGIAPHPTPAAGAPQGAAAPSADAVPARVKPGRVAPAATSGQTETHDAQMQAWRRKLHDALLSTIDLRRQDLTALNEERLREETRRLIQELVRSHEAELPRQIDRTQLAQQVLDESVGLGPLEPLLADEAITEIMVNRHDEIFVERGGRLQRHPVSFTSDRSVLSVIERIVTPLGRRIDESSPMVDARLRDGSRVNAIIAPLAVKGPCLTIRKFARRALTVDDLLAVGALSAPMAAFLHVCVERRKNVVVSGGTGSGKTTLLNILSNFIPDGERIVTIEDAAELRLNHSHLVTLEARPANAEGRGSVTIRDLVRNALRMRPDRIVVGECRGGEALDMLQAMNTGHEGSMTTLHANTPRDALARLETMVLMAGMELPLTAIREQVASAVDILVQQTRFGCGSRKVTSITEVTGMENGRLQLQELFRFDVKGWAENGKVQGQHTACDAMPSFYEELRAQGATVDINLFRSTP